MNYGNIHVTTTPEVAVDSVVTFPMAYTTYRVVVEARESDPTVTNFRQYFLRKTDNLLTSFDVYCFYTIFLNWIALGY